MAVRLCAKVASQARKWRNNGVAQGVKSLPSRGHWLQPHLAAPAMRDGFDLQIIQRVFVDVHEPGLQCAEPVIDFPAERNRVQGVARELSKRVMRHRLASVQEKRNFSAREHATKRIVV